MPYIDKKLKPGICSPWQLRRSFMALSYATNKKEYIRKEKNNAIHYTTR